MGRKRLNLDEPTRSVLDSVSTLLRSRSRHSASSVEMCALLEDREGEELLTQKKGCFRTLTDKIPARYVLVLLGFFGFFNAYALRFNLSVAIVAMVNNSAISGGVEKSKECAEYAPQYNGSTAHIKEGEFAWSSQIQGVILGSFFYGYVVTQIPGGRLSEVFGSKWMFGLGILCTALLTLLTPVAARIHVVALIIVRLLEGLGEGVTFPAMHAMLAKWLPKYERSFLTSFVYSGGQIGTVIALPVSGLLSDSNFMGGWPSVFYVFGIIGCVWFVFWCALIHNIPSDHPSISQAELLVIEQDQTNEHSLKARPLPWLTVLKSVPVWALIITHFTQNWGFYTLLTELPTYFKNILNLDIKANGLLSALPYLLQAIMSWFSSFVADRIRRKGLMSINAIRKTCNSIAFVAPAICLLGVTFAGCNRVVSIALFAIAMCINGMNYAGFMVTHVDMAPDFAGTLMGMTNSVANVAGILAPYTVGSLIETKGTISQWNIVFYIAAAIYLFGAVIFVVFGSAELQPWATPPAESGKPAVTSSEDQTPPLDMEGHLPVPLHS